MQSAYSYHWLQENLRGWRSATTACRRWQHSRIQHWNLGKPPDTILWEATHACGLPMLAFLGPPVTNCLSCNSPLQENHRPTSVVCYTLDGPIPALKITLRCRACQINYRYSQYGSKDDGYTYYRDHVRPFVEASQVCYIERRCCELWNAAR